MLRPSEIPKQRARWSRLTLYGAVVALGIFLCTLIAMLHNREEDLRAVMLTRIASTVDREARSLSHFLQESQHDLSDMTQSSSFANYYHSKALGMSMKYGLASTIQLMDARMEFFLNSRTLNGISIFDNVGFWDTSSNLFILKHHHTALSAPYTEEELTARIAKADSGTLLDILAGDERHVLLSVPYVHEQTIVGYVFATIPVEALKAYLSFIVTDIPHQTYLMHKRTTDSLSVGGPQLPADDLLHARQMPYEAIRRIGGTADHEAAFAIRCDVPGTVFDLYCCFAKDTSARGPVSSLSFAILYGIVIITLLTAITAARMAMRNASLASRIEAYRRNREKMSIQNSTLQLEIQSRKAAETKAVGLKTHAEQVNKVIPSGVYSTNQQGDIISWNNRAEEITGFPLEYALGKSRSFFIQGQELQTPLFGNPKNPDRGQQFIILTRTGETRTIILNKEPLTDPAGAFIGTVESFEDITEHLNAVLALARAEEDHRNLIQHAPYGIYQSTEAGEFTSLNPAMIEMFDYVSAEEMSNALNNRMQCLYADPTTRKSFLRELAKTGVVQNLTTQAITGMGRRIWIVENARVIVRPDGARFFEGFVLDITAQKQAELMLVEAKEAAEAANKSKSEFLANITHELRTPMTAIVGMADLNLRTEQDRQKIKNTTILRDAANALLKLLNDLLDFARIEADTMALDTCSFHLASLIEGTRSLMDMHAQTKGLELVTHIAPSLPEYVSGDADRIRQILINLVGNALKFTEQGSVVLSVSHHHGSQPPAPHLSLPFRDFPKLGEHEPDADEPAEREWVEFRVSDTGIGIAEDMRTHIFQSFAQADGSSSRRYGGVGLGLAISKRLAEIMEGSIHVESEVGAGSTFTVVLPLRKAPAPPVAATSTAQPGAGEALLPVVRGLNLLLAEDNRFNQLVICQMLEIDGHHATVAENGEHALSLLETQTFDAVLMDIQMPVMDGLEATRIIRSGTRPKIPTDIAIIPISAHIRPRELEQLDSLEIYSALPKPLLLAELRSLLADLFPARVTYLAEPSPSSCEETESPQTISSFPRICQLLAFKKGVIITLLSVYSQTMPGTMRTLEEHLAAGSFGDLRRMAHSLKSSVRNIGAEPLATLAEELEHCASFGNADRCAEIMPRLREQLTISISEVEHYLADIDTLLPPAMGDGLSS